MAIYEKWDSPEDISVAFEKVQNGEWSLQRFEEWCSQVRLDEYRNATADESS